MTESQGRNWAEYYAATEDRPPRSTLLDAVARFDDRTPPRFAVDLGCGDGRDAIELLRRGWSVLGIDAEPAAIAKLAAHPDRPAGSKLTTLCQRFEDATWPAADLVNSSFALPLCPPERFPELWRRIVASLTPGGRFAGQLYGDRDGWVGRSGITHLDRVSALALLRDLEIERFDEEESDAVTPRGKPKHWHVFHIIARRR
jgi:SAM-dependent methyltransferase